MQIRLETPTFSQKYIVFKEIFKIKVIHFSSTSEFSSKLLSFLKNSASGFVAGTKRKLTQLSSSRIKLSANSLNVHFFLKFLFLYRICIKFSCTFFSNFLYLRTKMTLNFYLKERRYI